LSALTNGRENLSLELHSLYEFIKLNWQVGLFIEAVRFVITEKSYTIA